MTRPLRVFIAATAMLVLFAPPAAAAGPANDRRQSALELTAVPSTVTLDTTAATSSRTDPGYCFGPELGPDPATVWFSYTATESRSIGVTTEGSDYDTTLYVGTATRGGGFEQIACNDDGRTLQALQRFDAVAGTTYLFMVGASPFGGTNGGHLVVNLVEAPAAQSVTVTLDPVGTIERGGVRFHGTASCTAPTTFQSVVIVELDQGTGDRAADYIGFADIAGCPSSEIPFEILVEPQVGKVKAGGVTLQVIFAACNDYECGNATIDSMEGTAVR